MRLRRAKGELLPKAGRLVDDSDQLGPAERFELTSA
jgi:hypothetical protein